MDKNWSLVLLETLNFFTDADATLDIKRVGATVPDLRIQDDMRIYFGSDKDSGIRFDENQTDTLRINGADWTYDNGVALQINDTTNASNAATGAVKIVGGLGVGATAWIKDLVVDDDVTLGTASSDTLTVESTTTFNADVIFNGVQTTTGTTNQTGQLNLDNIRLDGNTISTNAGSQLILDPDPRSGDAAGDLIVRGNLQVAGTTTTVNSTEMTVNDPVFNIGDTTSEKAVTTQAPGNSNTLNIDNPSGIATGGLVTGTNVGTGGRTINQIEVVFHVGSGFSSAPSVGDAIYHLKDGVYQQLGTFQAQTANTVRITLLAALSLRESSYYEGDSLTDGNSGTPQTAALTKDATNQTVFETTTLTLSSGISAQIEIGDFVTVTQGSNDGMDRGIQYSYHNGSAIKHGFFGFDRTAGEDGLGAFTFIEDATNTNNIFTHVVGTIQTLKIEQDDLDQLVVTTLPAAANQTYSNLSPTGGEGSGLTVNVARNASGEISI